MSALRGGGRPATTHWIELGAETSPHTALLKSSRIGLPPGRFLQKPANKAQCCLREATPVPCATHPPPLHDLAHTR